MPIANVRRRASGTGFAATTTFMSTLIQDVRYAVRTLTRTPAFTTVVVLTLALGIGINTSIFSVMDQVLLRLLPVKNPRELVQLDGPGPFRGRAAGVRTFSYPMYRDLRDRNDVFTSLVARAPATANLTYRGETDRVAVELISGNTFSALGVQPLLGRVLTDEDDRTPGGHPVTVLSHGFWQRRFGRDRSIVNQVVTINRTPMTVVGVAPAGFAGIVSAAAPDCFVPTMMKAEITPTLNDLDNRQSRWLQIVGRLKPGLTAEAAKPQLDVLYRQINEYELVAVPVFAAASQAFKDGFRGKQLNLYPAGRGLSAVRDSVTVPLYVLMAMVGGVLLIACANVANLLLARATGRQKEITIRLALGAGRARVTRQLLTESLILALVGGAMGLMLSAWLGELLVSILPGDQLSGAISTTLNLRVAGFSALLSAVTALLFGMAPALRGPQLELTRTLREEAGSVAGAAHHGRIRKGLVVLQVALSMLLVAGAGLFGRSLYNLKRVNPGFDTNNLISFTVNPALAGYDQAGIKRFYETLTARLRQQPGVLSASLAQEGVLTGSGARRTIRVDGYEPRPDENMNPSTNEVGPDYFRTMGLPLVAGREFTDRDAAGPPVAVVNETFARSFFGRDNPIGRRFFFRPGSDPLEVEIVGVVKNALYENMREGTTQDNQTPRFAYTPYQQGDELDEMTVYVRVSGSAAAAVPERIRHTMREVDARVPVQQMQRLQRTVEDALFNERMLALLSTMFGLLATGLASVGLYGVMSYVVSRRTREIGIRIALGAERGTVIGMVLSEVARLTVAGIALGVSVALSLSQLVRSQLFGISPVDPLTIAVAAVTLALVAMLAGYIPAKRASRVQPIVALRYD
jgi:predicted permease